MHLCVDFTSIYLIFSIGIRKSFNSLEFIVYFLEPISISIFCHSCGYDFIYICILPLSLIRKQTYGLKENRNKIYHTVGTVSNFNRKIVATIHGITLLPKIYIKYNVSYLAIQMFSESIGHGLWCIPAL